MPKPYPLLMTPALAPKVWGGSRIPSRVHPELAASAASLTEPVGEAWELADHPDGRSIIANGPWAGRSFSDLLAERPAELTDRPAEGRYPLMVKIIDAADDLSVQVHPDDALARRLATGDRGKSEFWFVMECDPDARVLCGLKPGADADALRGALERGDAESVCRFLPLRPGMCLDVPAGAVHALLRGTLVCEIQQASNTTFRLHDWNRLPARELHLEKGLAAARPDLPGPGAVSFLPPRSAGDPPARLANLVRNEHFSVRALALAPGATFRAGGRDDDTLGEGEARELIAVCVRGRGAVEADNSEADNSEADGVEAIPLQPGATVFLPAGLDKPATLRASAANDEECVILLARPTRAGAGGELAGEAD